MIDGDKVLVDQLVKQLADLFLVDVAYLLNEFLGTVRLLLKQCEQLCTLLGRGALRRGWGGAFFLLDAIVADAAGRGVRLAKIGKQHLATAVVVGKDIVADGL